MPPKAKKAAYKAPANLKSLRDAMEKRYGDSLVRHEEDDVELEFITTGVTSLDVGLGGGWARGRYHQVVGQPNCCKTALTIIALVNALERYPDEGVAYIDVERTVTRERFLSQGLDPDDKRFFWLKPKSGEEVCDMLRDQMRTGLMSIIAIDSVGAIGREEELYDKDAADEYVGRAAKLLTRMTKQITTIANDTNTAVLQVNQFRKDFASGMDVASGPTIMGYMTTDSVSMRRLGGADNVLKIKDADGDEIEVAHKVAAKVERSKLVPQGKVAMFWYHKADSEYGEIGIDQVKEAFDSGTKTGVIYKENAKSSWWFFPDGQKANGEAACLQVLREQPDVLEAVRAGVVQKLADPQVNPEDKIEFRRG